MLQIIPQDAIVDAIKEQAAEARRRKLVKRLMGSGLIPRTQNDNQIRHRLARLMANSQGPSPAGAIATDTEIDGFLEYHAARGWDFEGRTDLAARVPDPEHNEPGEIYGLVKETCAAADTGSDRTLTWESNQAIKDARLWVWTAKGNVTQITNLEVNDDDVKLGPGDFLPAEAADFGAGDDPQNRGLFVGDLNKLSITCSVADSADDVTWGILVEGELPNRARRMFSLFRRRRGMRR